MPFSLPPLREIPTIWPALRWLLARRGGPTSKQSLLVKARLCGLISGDNSPNWKVNGPLATRLVLAAMKRLPNDPAELGRVLHGLGEMNARMSLPIFKPLISHLRSRSHHVSVYKVLAAATECEVKPRALPSLSAIDLAQWVSGAPLNWATFTRAVYRIGHPEFSISPGRFGLDFVAKIVAAVEPRAIHRWIAGHRNRAGVAILANAMLPAMYDTDLVGRAASLLKSRIPALKCLAAALHIHPIFPDPAWDAFRDCRKTLTSNGVDPGDATWMMAYRISAPNRHRIEQDLQGNRARLRQLEATPETAIGGRHNAEAEKQIVQNRISKAVERLSKLTPELDAAVGELAVDWPSEGLTDHQMVSLESSSVGNPEVRHRLAEKLPAGPNRTALLKRNVDELSQLIGNSDDALDAYFNVNDNHLDVILTWAAQSLILLYADDKRGIGKRTSDLVAGITENFEALADEPFAAARQPGRWQSAFGRAASAYTFALFVVAVMPEQRRAEVEVLNELALDHVHRLLLMNHPDFRASQLIFKLTARAVLQMDYFASSQKRRRIWAESPETPIFARALALWSSPTLVEEKRTLAFELLRQVAELPLSRSAYDLQISRLLTLADLAVARCISAGKAELVRELISIWPEVYRPWLSIIDQWANAPELMAAAVEGEGPERAAFLAEPSLASTHCFRLIERAEAPASCGCSH